MTPVLREAVRGLVRSPAFAATAIASVGVAIGLAGSAFSVMHAAFFAKLPYEEPDRLVELWGTQEPASARVSDYLQPVRMLGWVSAETRSLEGVAGVTPGMSLVMRRAEGPVRIEAAQIVGDLFGVLGVQAARGRLLTPADLAPGAEPAAVVSAAFARAWLDEPLGATLDLSGTSFTVVGVMPAAFESAPTLWLPAERLPSASRPVAYRGVARLRDGASFDEAVAEVRQMAAAEVAADSVGYGGFGATARPMGAQGRGASNKPMLWTLTGVVVSVLLIGLGNLSQLFLVRAQGRSRMLAVRASLGGSAWQIGRGLVAEALIVGFLGAASGVLLTFVGKDVFRSLLGGELSLPGEPTVGLPVVALALGLGTLVSVVVGMEPLRRLATLDLQAVLQRRAAGSESTPGERRTRNGLVAVQVGASLVLVAVAGVLWTAYAAFARLDVGYDAERVVQAVPDYELTGLDGPEQWQLARRLGERLGRRHEVAGVALWQFVGMDYPPRPEYEAVTDGPDVELGTFDGLYGYYQVEPGFFDAMGITLVSGRAFGAADRPGAEPVAIVTVRGARLWWPGIDPLGRQIKLGQDGTWMTIAGVTEDIKRLDFLGRATAMRPPSRAMPLLFVPAAQAVAPVAGWRTYDALDDQVVIGARAAASTAEAARALREELAGLAPTLPLERLGTILDLQMDGYQGRTMRVAGRMVGAGTAVALLLAVVGIVGVVAESLARRTREIGVRVALGARAHQITRVVARESVLTAVGGVALGLTGIAVLDRTASTFVFGYTVLRIGPNVLDPWVVGPACMVVIAIMVTTAVLVAMRAWRVDPAIALRSE